MADEIEVDGDDLKEDEVAFFKCKHCGSRTLLFTYLVHVCTRYESTLACQCGKDDQAASRREQVTTRQEESGYVTKDRHVQVEDSEILEEIDRDVEDEQVTCTKCYEEYGHEVHLWEEICEPEVDRDDDAGDLTIRCGGCDREIEFGYSHPNKQGCIFLGEDDSAFDPLRTFPDPKYMEKWRARGWLRPDGQNASRDP